MRATRRKSNCELQSRFPSNDPTPNYTHTIWLGLNYLNFIFTTYQTLSQTAFFLAAAKCKIEFWIKAVSYSHNFTWIRRMQEDNKTQFAYLKSFHPSTSQRMSFPLLSLPTHENVRNKTNTFHLNSVNSVNPKPL
jgi:hypothetical protein